MRGGRDVGWKRSAHAKERDQAQSVCVLGRGVDAFFFGCAAIDFPKHPCLGKGAEVGQNGRACMTCRGRGACARTLSDLPIMGSFYVWTARACPLNESDEMRIHRIICSRAHGPCIHRRGHAIYFWGGRNGGALYIWTARADLPAGRTR